MNTTFVTQQPPGEFAHISERMPQWETEFMRLIEDRKPITYAINEVSEVPRQIEEALTKHGYARYILRNAYWQNFLLPLLITAG